MPKKNNNGFSMVEILISIAIFAVLMIPIVSGIINSLKNATNAKTLQYRNEFAENVMEYVKEDSLDNILRGNYLSSVGSYTSTAGKPVTVDATFYLKDSSAPILNSSLTAIKDALKANLNVDAVIAQSAVETPADPTDPLSTATVYPYEEYDITGNVRLGTKHTAYTYKMQISNKYYAQKEMNASYVNPNNLALGIVEDIDYNKIALFNGTIANYDQSVANAFLTTKIGILKSVDSDWYEIYTHQASGADIFPSDTVTRQIVVKVEGSESTGYKVSCGLRYHDNSETNSKVANALTTMAHNAGMEDDYYVIEYIPFVYEYDPQPTQEVQPDGTVATVNKAKLPNIYLMYNICLYNSKYSDHDYIVFDTSGVTDDTKVNCFVVQTAEKYSTALKSANTTLDDTKILYNSNVTTGSVLRENVKIHMVAKSGSKLNNLCVYSNFDLSGTGTGQNKKNSNILYNSSQTNWNYGLNSTYIPLVKDGDAANSVANFGSLDSAEEETRGLYDVKLWLVEGENATIDTTKDPILTATKGGNES